MINTLRITLRLSLLAAFTACSLSPDLPTESPALTDMHEPIDLRTEPNDETQRLKLNAGTFAGLYLGDPRKTLAAKLDSPDSVAILRVVENSPAAQAGLLAGDLLLEVEVDGLDTTTLSRPSEWRQIELTAQPGAKVVMFVDRAGREARTEFTLVARQHPAKRELAERFREEQRIGVVFRTATEVEARSAKLGPGAGAVIVGMSQRSPWRDAGLIFGDLLTAIDDQPIAHPQELLTAARDTERDSLELTYIREGVSQTVSAALTDREQKLTQISVPVIFSYDVARGRTEWSLALGLVKYQSTAAAWHFRLFWLMGFGGGDSDQLMEQGS